LQTHHLFVSSINFFAIKVRISGLSGLIQEGLVKNNNISLLPEIIPQPPPLHSTQIATL
jgi:hypothetical protein